MKTLEVPSESIARSQELNKYHLLDTLPEEEFDNITAFVAEVCNTPICVISLIDVDRQFFKSTYGFHGETPDLEYSPCNYTLHNDGNIFMVEDTQKDVRFKDNPLTKGEKGIVFYAGVPLISANGIAIGSLCVVDHKPNSLSEFQIKFLKRSATNIMKLFELRATILELKNTNIEMERFAYTAAQDIKSPLNHMIQLNKLIDEELSPQGNEHLKKLIDRAGSYANKLKSLVDGILNHSKSENIVTNVEVIDFNALVASVFSLFKGEENHDLIAPSERHIIKTNKVVLEQMLVNLISNAIKHNDKSYVSVEVNLVKTEDSYRILVTDNGSGISKENQEIVFKIFEKINEKDRFGNETSGIGLATVKKLADAINAKIEIDSIPKCGTTFIIEIPR